MRALCAYATQLRVLVLRDLPQCNDACVGAVAVRCVDGGLCRAVHLMDAVFVWVCVVVVLCVFFVFCFLYVEAETACAAISDNGPMQIHYN